MKDKEIIQIILAIATLGIVYGFNEIAEMNLNALSAIIGFSAIIIGINILSKKIVASRLDADVEHEIWQVKRFGFHPGDNFKKSISAGILIPLFVTLVTLGSIAPMTVMTYETRALKRRAAKRFGFYSYKEMTDWHNGLIGATGIVSILALAIIAYLLPINIEYLSKLAVYYAFWNLIPLAKLDGTQIFFGSKLVWTALALITTIFTALALLTP